MTKSTPQQRALVREALSVLEGKIDAETHAALSAVVADAEASPSEPIEVKAFRALAAGGREVRLALSDGSYYVRVRVQVGSETCDTAVDRAYLSYVDEGQEIASAVLRNLRMIEEKRSRSEASPSRGFRLPPMPFVDSLGWGPDFSVERKF